MARRRHQNPNIREGLWWYLRVWEYSFVDGKQVRKLKRIKLAEASKKEREVKTIADEIVRPINHGQITFGAAVNFGEYVKQLSQTVAAEKRFVSVPNRALAASEAKKSQVIKDFLREHEIH